MKTPKKFTENLKNRIITKEMLSTALYSVNKRAKNCRDKERSSHNDIYDTKEKYRLQKEEYYELKDLFLSLLKPDCIHKELFIKRSRVRYYDYECDIYSIPADEIIHRGEYYDKEMREYVEFVDVIEEEEFINYYLFYDLGEYCFHHPISEDSISLYDLPVKDIDMLNTYGKDINDLISVQFVRKLESLIKSKDYVYVDQAEVAVDE